MEYTVKKDSLEITFSSLGAEMISVKKNGKERLWQNDNGAWGGHAPILFPYAGTCTFIKNGIVSEMKQHGIARRNEFELIRQTDDSIEFVLKSNEKTRELYPCDFELYVTYTLYGDSVEIEWEVRNPGKEITSFAIGGHETYALDEDVKNYEIVFEKDEVFDSWVMNKNNHLTGEKIHIGEGKILSCNTTLLDDAKTVVLIGVNSRFMTLRNKVTKEEVATLSYPGFKNVFFWHCLGSKMICLEPWINIPDYDNDTREFSDKETTINLKPGENAVFKRVISYK